MPIAKTANPKTLPSNSLQTSVENDLKIEENAIEESKIHDKMVKSNKKKSISSKHEVEIYPNCQVYKIYSNENKKRSTT